jgi:hypothetical protein
MKFVRQFSRARRPVTGRRLAAARRTLQRQAEEVALFPELQPKETPAERVARLDLSAEAHFQSLRDYTAQTWRRTRAEFRTLTPAQREYVSARWNDPYWGPPHHAGYLADLIWCARKEV